MHLLCNHDIVNGVLLFASLCGGLHVRQVPTMNSVPQYPSGDVAMNMESATELWELKTEYVSDLVWPCGVHFLVYTLRFSRSMRPSVCFQGTSD